MSEKIKPQHFYTDTPPERIIGTECEYIVQVFEDEDAQHIDRFASPAAIRTAGYKTMHEYLSNGGRLYVDGSVLEYATPECLGPRQAAAADLAGMEVVRRVVSGSKQNHDGIYRYASADVLLPEHRLARFDRKTTGYHENFMVPRACIDETFGAVMPAYLASRIWAMSGILQSDGFKFSQKIAGLGGDPIHDSKDNRRIDEDDKPMILVPSGAQNEDVNLDDRWARVEVRYADPGLSPIVRYVSLAATSLVLRLVEHADMLGNRPTLDAMRLKDPLEAAQTITNSLSLSTLVQTVDNQFVTANDMSEMLAIQAEYLSRHVELPEDEAAAIPLWFDLITLLRQSVPSKGEYGDLIQFCDFAARHRRLLSRSKGEKLTSRSEKQITTATNWDRIDTIGTGIKWWQHFDTEHVPQQLIDSLVTTPPATRAAERAKIIATQDPKIKYMTWARYVIDTDKKMSFTDPYGQ